MDFIDQLRVLSSSISNLRNMVHTEEATKNAMIMPFIQALGYNVFDPTEVTPELTADIGTKKGEKVDYAILKDGKPIMLFECKKCGDDLNINHASQLFRYYHVTEARFGILTNGVVYRFYTDLEQPNKMDEKPFLEFDLLDFRDQDVEELKKFAKSSFDVEQILTTAHELKYTRYIQNLLLGWISNPSEEFVRLLSNDLLAGRRFTPAVKEQFTEVTKRAFLQFINDRINERLKVAMTDSEKKIEDPVPSAAPEEQKPQELVASSDEVEAFQIIRAILREAIDPRRIFLRKAQSYSTVLLDDSNRKSICRLRFNNTAKMVLGLVAGRDEEKVTLADLSDIFKYSGQIKAAASAVS